MTLKHSKEELKQYHDLSLGVKVLMSRQRIRDWVNEYGEENCCVLLDGTPESAALMGIAAKFCNVKGVHTIPADAKAITPWMACKHESEVTDWLRYGCNHYDTKKPESRPLAFWTEQDVQEYLEKG